MSTSEFQRKRLGLPEPVWSGPSYEQLRNQEHEIWRLRRGETEVAEAHHYFVSKGNADRAAMEADTLDGIRKKRQQLEDQTAAHAARAAAQGLVTLDDCQFAKPIERHGQYVRLEPMNALGKLTGEQWRGIEKCEWVDPTHDTVSASWAFLCTQPADAPVPVPPPASEHPIIAFRERESMAEAGVVLRREWRVRDVTTFMEDVLAASLGGDWRYYHPYTTHVVEERALRGGEPMTAWTVMWPLYSYEAAVEQVDSGAVFVCPILRELHERREAAQRAAIERAAAEIERERQAAADQEAARRKAYLSEAAFRRLLVSTHGVWAERWNAFTASATPEQRERLRADETAVRLHDAVLAAETVPAKRKAIKAFLTHVEGART
jgi:hypothetical protein